MTSYKPKIQGVIHPDLHALFIEWKESIGAKSEGQALNTLLSIFFERPLGELMPDRDRMDALEERLSRLTAEINALKEFKFSVRDTIDTLTDTVTRLTTAVAIGAITNDNDHINDDKSFIDSDNQKITRTIGKRAGNEPNDKKVIISDNYNINNDKNLINTDSTKNNIAPVKVERTAHPEDKSDKNNISSDTPSEEPSGLTGVELSRRLKVSEKAIRNHRDNNDLAKWSLNKDPEGKAWRYDNKRYYPINN